MPKQLFGTDGIRGVAGEYPLDDATVHATGWALGELVAGLDSRPRVLIGIDTRESGPRLAQLLAGGLDRAGVPCSFAGVIPTPAIASLTNSGPFAAGVVISASHNPYRDNGIKVFAHSGFKLPDEQEEQVENGIARLRGNPHGPAPLGPDPALALAYLDHLANCVPAGQLFRGRIVVDCANGAAHRIAPQLFERLGVEAQMIADRPDGRNINLDCGSLHLGLLRRQVLESKAEMGVALDGDADRALFISSSGREVNGDAVLWIAARHFGAPLVVATTMSNLGLEHALAARGVALVRTPVGDKYVLEEMLRRNALLGGEQSGHVIFRQHATTGDGLLTALKVLEIMGATGRTLDQLIAGLPAYPQTIRNIPVRARPPLEGIPALQDALRSSQQALAGRGRIVVRYSGTEPLARVMVEAQTEEEVDLHAGRLAQVITEQIGASTTDSSPRSE